MQLTGVHMLLPEHTQCKEIKCNLTMMFPLICLLEQHCSVIQSFHVSFSHIFLQSCLALLISTGTQNKEQNTEMTELAQTMSFP